MIVNGRERNGPPPTTRSSDDDGTARIWNNLLADNTDFSNLNSFKRSIYFYILG